VCTCIHTDMTSERNATAVIDDLVPAVYVGMYVRACVGMYVYVRMCVKCVYTTVLYAVLHSMCSTVCCIGGVTVI